MDLHAHSGKKNFIDIFSLFLYLMIFLPSSKKLDFAKNIPLFIECKGKLTRTCAPIDDPIEEWVGGWGDGGRCRKWLPLVTRSLVCN